MLLWNGLAYTKERVTPNFLYGIDLLFDKVASWSNDAGPNGAHTSFESKKKSDILKKVNFLGQHLTEQEPEQENGVVS